jgi:prevent-host-death family protein
MNKVTANRFRLNLEREVDRVVEEHAILWVTRKRGGDFVVVSADDWRAIEETLFLNRVPGLVESIQRASEEPLDEGTLVR